MRRHSALRRESQLAARAAIALTALVLLADSIVSLWTGLYLNLGGGVWLALAHDVRDGIFYRPIWNGMEYGGTRYFPMLFVSTGALMRLGLPAVTAGVAVSMAGMIAMGASVVWLLERWSVPRTLALFGGALALAPYFVHQTGFAIRCEPIAAAFAIAGLAVLGPLRPPDLSTRRLALAAVLFVAGFAAKITCVYAPAAAVAALLLSRRPGSAARLALFTIGAAVVFLLAVHVVSDGRALESFRACALAGSDPGSLLSAAAILRPLELVAGSHILSLVFLVTGAALLVTRGLWRELPGLYFLAVLGVTGIIFTSPGTIITSHIVDAYAAAIVVLVIAVARARPRWQLAGTAALLLITFIDLDHRFIPDEVSLPGIAVGLGVSLLPGGIGIANAALGALLGGGILWLVAWGYERFAGREGMGYGDVKLLAMIGAFLGWQAIPAVIIIASLAGSVAGLVAMLDRPGRRRLQRVASHLGPGAVAVSLRRASRRTEIPFGPFLALGALLVLYAPGVAIPFQLVTNG